MVISSQTFSFIWIGFYHVKILVFVQIVDLKQVLRFEAVILAALEEQLYIFPLFKEKKKPKIQSRETF